ncbi:MAG: DUF962 domain-containing protein [Comamonas sp.]
MPHIPAAPPSGVSGATASGDPAAPVDPRSLHSFAAFYPFYLSEHRDSRCRRLHFLGSTLGLLCVAAALWWRQPWFVLLGLVLGYACAWIGHFGFEHNRPASFQRPLYSFMGDWRMYADMWRGKVPF